ncbi:hypothetical protein FA13DRAFT_1716749 [Coprinellus micaceus]|uniref:Uncharacterized protein n=1 Tax=Coprinellus micaceus TaxID=71717 RepID=A0A4Y7SI72_COPMI|nr:hypothetical protein FA13DRAFT_1716749 [Coprinellus micaceus]
MSTGLSIQSLGRLANGRCNRNLFGSSRRASDIRKRAEDSAMHGEAGGSHRSFAQARQPEAGNVKQEGREEDEFEARVSWLLPFFLIHIWHSQIGAGQESSGIFNEIGSWSLPEDTPCDPLDVMRLGSWALGSLAVAWVRGRFGVVDLAADGVLLVDWGVQTYRYPW